ncbi:MAG: DUF6769 family protein [Rikenellaceae bacterium]
MKRSLSILFIAASTFLLFAFTILPHHHHGEIACILKHCVQENNDNNECDKPQEGSCLIETGYVAFLNDNATRCNISSCCDNDHIHLFPMVFIFSDLLASNVYFLNQNLDYKEYHSFYKSIYVGNNRSLRAPPCFFC